MKLDVDLTNIEIRDGFDPIPAGTYDLLIRKGEVRPSSRSDYDYVNWELEVTGDPDYSGEKIFHITSLHPKALQMPSGLKALWEALSLPLNDVNITDAIGLTVTAEVGQEIYKPANGGEERVQNTIKRFIY